MDDASIQRAMLLYLQTTIVFDKYWSSKHHKFILFDTTSERMIWCLNFIVVIFVRSPLWFPEKVGCICRIWVINILIILMFGHIKISHKHFIWSCKEAIDLFDVNYHVVFSRWYTSVSKRHKDIFIMKNTVILNTLACSYTI